MKLNLVIKIKGGLLTWKVREEIPSIFIITLIIVMGLILISAVCTSPPREDCYRGKSLCDEQKEYAIELIRIHESFVDELARARLLIRQSFFLVVTGLLSYYLIKRKGKKTPLIKRDLLLILLLFATIICHLNEGIMNKWQAEHLNKICILEGALDSAVFPGWFQDSHIYLYKELPRSYVLFTFSIHLNASSIAFYYFTLILAVLVIFYAQIKE